MEIKKYPIADLHCDLLSYLAESGKKTFYDPESRCSMPFLKEGGVAFQTMAVFTETRKGSVKWAEKQISLFKSLPFKLPVALAIENASGILEEDEQLEKGLERLQNIGPLLYISLTWNNENRFGGGNATRIGLKRDGEVLLDYLSGKNICIDFSHTSDALAYDILNHIEKRKLLIKPLASHSNFRSITDVPRNLPDEIAKEILRRQGMIGLNFVRHFIGRDPHDLIRHIEHALTLGAEDQICFGADFFAANTIPPELEYLKPFFFPDFDNASCYPRVLEMARSSIPEKQLEKIAYKNLTIGLIDEYQNLSKGRSPSSAARDA